MRKKPGWYIEFKFSLGREGRSLQPRSIYTFTRICLLEYIKRMESAFAIIAEPNRRAMLSLLASSQHSVGEIERQLGMPQPSRVKAPARAAPGRFGRIHGGRTSPSLPAET